MFQTNYPAVEMLIPIRTVVDYFVKGLDFALQKREISASGGVMPKRTLFVPQVLGFYEKDDLEQCDFEVRTFLF